MRGVIELRGRSGFRAMASDAESKTELSVPDEDHFNFRLETCEIGAITAHRIHISPCRSLRGMVVESEVVNLALITRGSQAVQSSRNRQIFNPGQIIAQVGWNRHLGENEGIHESMMLRIDTSALVERGVDIAADSMLFGPDRPTTTTHALSALIKSTLHGQSLTDVPTPSAIENAALELVVGLHHDSMNYRGSSVEIDVGLLARARVLIGASYRDHRLTPALLADRLDVSVRKLQRVFEKADTTVAVEIRGLRTEYAAGLLRSRSSNMSLSDVAAAAGFTSTGELRRAVRTSFDRTPSQLRR